MSPNNSNYNQKKCTKKNRGLKRISVVHTQTVLLKIMFSKQMSVAWTVLKGSLCKYLTDHNCTGPWLLFDAVTSIIFSLLSLYRFQFCVKDIFNKNGFINFLPKNNHWRHHGSYFWSTITINVKSFVQSFHSCIMIRSNRLVKDVDTDWKELKVGYETDWDMRQTDQVHFLDTLWTAECVGLFIP